jgi:hypothetical protein
MVAGVGNVVMELGIVRFDVMPVGCGKPESNTVMSLLRRCRWGGLDIICASGRADCVNFGETGFLYKDALGTTFVLDDFLCSV